MSRIIGLVIVLLGAAAISYIAVAGPDPNQAPDPSESSNLYLPLVLRSAQADSSAIRTGGPLAATELRAEVLCEQPGKPIARLSWKPAAIPGSEQRVDVTIYSFEAREFQDSKPLPPEQSSLTRESLSGQAGHHWRVLTLHEDGWVSSEISSFEGPTCVGPTPQPPQPPVR